MRHVLVGLMLAASLALGVGTANAGSPQRNLAIQVDENNPATMNLALNNAQNVIEYYKKKNQRVDVRIVTFGPGLHMLRSDTSPVKTRIAEMSLANSNLHFFACENTREKMAKAENKEIPILAEAQSVPSGVVTLMELQVKGYTYLRP